MISNELKKILSEVGEKKIVSGNTPFFIDDPKNAWFINTGKIDLFRVQKVDGELQGARHHFVSFNENEMMLGIDVDSDGLGLSFLAVGSVNTEVIVVDLEKIIDLSFEEKYKNDFVELINNWIDKLSEGLARPIYPKPRADILITSTESIKFATAKRIKTRKDIYWIEKSNANCLFVGMEQMDLTPDSSPFPLSSFGWLEILETADFNFSTTEEIIENRKLWEGLNSFYNVLLYCELMNSSMIKADELGRMNLKAELQAKKEEEALSELSKIIDDHKIKSYEHDSDADPVFKAVQLIADELGVTAIQPDAEVRKISKESPVNLIAESSGLRVREIKFEKNWWKYDSGHLFAVRADNSPIALIRKKNKYIAYDTKKNESFVVDLNSSTEIQPAGYMFYKGFNDSKPISLKDIFTFGLKGVQYDILKILLYASLASLLGLLVPIFTGIVYDSVIPSQDKANLGFLILVLISTSFVITIFKISQSIVNVRLQAKFDYQLEAAVWDRVLSLPAKFFSKFNSGNLAKRVSGIQMIRETVVSVLLSSVFDITFALFNFILLFYYSSLLALWAAIPIAISVVLIFYLGYQQIKLRRFIQELEQFIQGFLLQVISGISKLRASATESSAFAEWAKKFTLLRKYEFKSRLLVNYQEIFFSAFPIITAMIFFYIVIDSIEADNLSTGQFIAFNTAYAAFLMAVIGISQKIVQVLRLEAVYVNAKPVLNQLPEGTESKPKAKELSGAIELRHVNFRYNEDSPKVLKDVSITANPGEFIAIVGPSGSGKSTLLRVLMGFEKPESGSVYYDSYDISKVDIKSIRRQVGVVLQNGKLLTGSILQNIIGSSNLSVDDAWEAAVAAGFDQDINEMPMGMFTVVSENGSTLSGGQRQRLMIARAVARKPKIIMMDEATSALDNRTQEIVSRSLEQLQATRIVIAHRLSTILNADKIIVMRNGIIEQSGSYNELMNMEGLFRDLAMRQIA